MNEEIQEVLRKELEYLRAVEIPNDFPGRDTWFLDLWLRGFVLEDWNEADIVWNQDKIEIATRKCPGLKVVLNADLKKELEDWEEKFKKDVRRFFG